MNIREIDVVLASTSPYRAELLRRVLADFTCVAPAVDESILTGETPLETATRLAYRKASAVAAKHASALILGSDQVAEVEGRILGKPGSIENARSQLTACSGKIVRFHTAICLVDPRDGSCYVRDASDLTTVHFRTIGREEIDRYLEADRPYDCAGSFRIEKRGITLFERVESNDPTALVGLPLIATCRLLREAGHALP